MTRRELLGVVATSIVAWPASAIARAQDKTKSAAKTATVTLAISGRT